MRRRARRGQRGATAVTVAILLVTIGAFMALVLNVGQVMHNRTQLQTSSDAAAIAGAKKLDGTAAGITAARAAAQSYAERHNADAYEIVIDANASNAPDGDIVFGTWTFGLSLDAQHLDPGSVGSAFQPAALADLTDAPEGINAVLVRNGREAKRDSAIDIFFGGGAFLGQSTTDVPTSAIATGGGPCSTCPLPFVLADCQVLDDDDNLLCDRTFTFAPDGDDTIGFSSLSGDSVNNDTVRDLIADATAGTCHRVGVDDSIEVQNGNDFNKQIVDELEAYIAAFGNEVTVPVATPSSGCPDDPKFNQEYEVVALATITIESFSSGGGGKGSRNIRITFECDKETPDPGGCADLGTISTRPQLVR